MRTTMTSTTTTTTVLNGASGNGAGPAAASATAARLNRMSLDSAQLQAQNRSRPELFENPRRQLQTQISQLSSVGDAHSLLEQDVHFPEGQLQRQPTMCSIDELTDDLGISRSRLKLTRITRHSGVAGVGSEVAGVGGDDSQSGRVRKAKAKALKGSSALKGLRAKFNWRARRKGGHKPQTQAAKGASDDSGERAAF